MQVRVHGRYMAAEKATQEMCGNIHILLTSTLKTEKCYARRWYPPVRILSIMPNKTILRTHTDMETSSLTCFLIID
jgi:hypothetical protein